MADPIPVNSRRDRNPPVPAPTPFGGGVPLGNLPARPPLPGANANPFAAARAGAQPMPARPAFNPPPPPLPPARPAPNLPPARQPPQGALFDRRNADRRAVGRRREQNAARGERIMHILAGIVLTTIVLLSRAAQDSPSRAEAYEPRGAASVPVEAAAPAETSASVETLSVLTGVVTTRELVRSCASVTCTALDAPTVLETGMTVTLIARDESRAWVQVSGTDGSAWRGWLPLASLRSDGDIGALPAV